jgi:hypothetical protein
MGKHLLRILLLLLPLTAVAEQWLFDDQYILGGLGYEDKMPDPDKYKGTKLILEGRYIVSSEEQPVDAKRLCCEVPAKPSVYLGVLQGMLRMSSDNKLEYVGLGIVPWAKMWDPGQESDKKWQARRDLLEFGISRFVSDEALELDSYAEVGLFRAGRVGEFKPSPNSNWQIDLGAQASLGWAWAESEVEEYSQVSNPFAGIYLDAAWAHKRFGSIYFVGRFVNGFSFSNPSRGSPTAREAKVRNGYTKLLGAKENYELDVYWEKRSFYFDEGGLPGLYSWVRTYGAELTWMF